MPSSVFAQLATAAGIVFLVVAILAVGAFVYASRQIMRLPPNTPEAFLSHPTADGRPVVACLGASIVHGRVGASFVDLLAARHPDLRFVNAGYNGDMALHVLRRLEPVIACRPAAIAILVGSNDVIGTLDAESWRRYQGEKQLSGPPSLDAYRQTMAQIVRDLKTRTAAPIALCSLPILGEALTSLPNTRVAEFNAVLRDVAGVEGAAYLSVFECEADALADHQRSANIAGQAFNPDFRVYGRIMFLAALQRYLLGRSFDDVAQRSGLFFKTDLIHGNTREAAIIAGEIEEFLKTVDLI